MKNSRGFLCLVVAVTMVSLTGAAAYAGLGDKLKKKANDTANKAANDALNKAPETPATKPDETGTPPQTPGSAAPADEVSRVSTKFDYVPGDKVLFYDDFTQDELGEFPAAWQLKTGTFEVAELGGRRWLRCTSLDSDIRMKLPAMAALPEYWTLEFDFLCEQASGNVLTVYGRSGEQEVWSAVFPVSGRNLYFTSGQVTSDTPFEGADVWGVPHHVMFMARGKALKVYVDRQRMASVPEINPAPGAPTTISYRLWSDKQPMISNVRFAEGNKPVQDPFADGKLVTYGIYFASGSDAVEPESAPVLRQIAAYLTAKPDVKLRIVGHTDNQGVPEGNLDLSRRRAAAVAAVLTAQFNIAADRFQADGKGDTVPVSDNAKPEGRAMNRRVEFSKV